MPPHQKGLLYAAVQVKKNAKNLLAPLCLGEALKRESIPNEFFVTYLTHMKQRIARPGNDQMKSRDDLKAARWSLSAP